jgi:hypothetical protein
MNTSQELNEKYSGEATLSEKFLILMQRVPRSGLISITAGVSPWRRSEYNITAPIGVVQVHGYSRKAVQSQ